MSDLVRLDRQRIRDLVVEVMKGYPEVLGAYLFGSALDRCRPDSDVDVGVFVQPDLSERDRFALENRLAQRLTPVDGHPFDLTVVDPRQTHFAFRVFNKGVPLFVGDPERLTDLMERVSREHGELAYRYQLSVREILEEAGRHGP